MLLKQAKINGFLIGVVSSKLIEGFDNNGDERIDWEEFNTLLMRFQMNLNNYKN